MKVNRKELSDALATLSKVVDKKSSIPIIRSVLMETDGALLRLRTTDLNRTLTTAIHSDGPSFDTCINADKLLKIIKADTGESKGKKALATVEITVSENAATVEIDGIKVKLPTLPAADFPTAPTRDDWKRIASWESKTLAGALGHVLPVASVDFTRPHINAVSFVHDGRIAATDGHRLHVAPIPALFEKDVTIPRDAATTLAGVLKLGESTVLDVQKESPLGRFTIGVYQLTVRLSETDFPPIDQVIPSRRNQDVTAVVNAERWSKALKKLRAVMDSEHMGVKLVVNGSITMEVEDPDTGAVECQIEATHGNDGETKTIGVNGSLLFDALVDIEGDVEVMIWAPLDPIRIDSSDGRIAIVMPMRI